VASRWQDQAAGLRQLLGSPNCRSVSFCGGRGEAGTTSLVINLAAALFERSRDVMVLDEFDGPGNITNRLHLHPHFDFEQVLRREASLADAVLQTGCGFQLLPLAARAQIIATLNEREQHSLSADLEELACLTDWLLLDTRPGMSTRLPGLSMASDDVVIVLSNRAESLTDAYAAIKLLATEYGHHEFRILVNRVPDLETASMLFGRIRQVARQYLGAAIHLRLIGFVPESDALHRAMRQGQSVLAAFPESDAAIAFRQLADAMLRWAPPQRQTESPAGFVAHLIESSRVLTERLKHG
jgi:flagellar biosynthesis protein FlhG